jgi:hypothetical protein
VHIPKPPVIKPSWFEEFCPGCLVNVKSSVKKMPTRFVDKPGLVRNAAELGALVNCER